MGKQVYRRTSLKERQCKGGPKKKYKKRNKAQKENRTRYITGAIKGRRLPLERKRREKNDSFGKKEGMQGWGTWSAPGPAQGNVNTRQRRGVKVAKKEAIPARARPLGIRQEQVPNENIGVAAAQAKNRQSKFKGPHSESMRERRCISQGKRGSEKQGSNANVDRYKRQPARKRGATERQKVKKRMIPQR